MRAVHRPQTNPLSPVMLGAASLCLLMAVQIASANPTGGTVASGDASISTSGTTTTITQTTQKAIINWHDFSINPNETTEFVQPSSSAVMLNRVTGGNVSNIMGNLKANGKIYLINPNGILFGSTSVVNVGGLVASTSPITDNEFLNDSIQRFNQSNAGASIINNGNITIKNAGLAVLVSPTVVNNGVIIADLGVVSIASADHFTLDLYGDNLITLDAGKVLQTDGLVENNGTLQADGGKVYITAQAADDMLENVVNMNGYISAQTVSTQKGKVVLQGYDNSTINIAGTIDISGDTGGQLDATAKNINLLDNSLIDASGVYGGGLVNIGGEYQGGGTLAHADFVTMNSGATINADAIENGNGGQIVLWSDLNTDAYGSIFARGGALSGDGGLIETSSHQVLDTAGITVSASAPNGKNGLWFIDPVTLTITDALAIGYNAALAGGTDVSISTGDGIEFNNTGTNIVWGTAADLSIRSNADGNDIATSPSTITYNGGCGAGLCEITSTGAGNIEFFYNPANAAIPYEFPTAFPKVFTTGTGIFTPYMLINTVAELNLVGSNATTVAQNYALNNDLSVGAFTSIGGQGSGLDFSGSFTGSIQGTQYTLSDIVIAGGGTDEVGLFGSADNATIKDVTVVDSTITGDNEVGAIIGLAQDTALEGNFSVSNNVVMGDVYVGGIAGRGVSIDLDGLFTFTDGAVTGTNFAHGGIFGGIEGANTLSPGTLLSALDGTVTGDTFVGGLIGAYANGVVWNATGTFENYATVSGTSEVGGIFGRVEDDINLNLSNFGNVTSTGPTVGGVIGSMFAGQSSGELRNYGDVTGTVAVGGIVGINEFGATLLNALLLGGTITGTSQVGGIAGNNAGTLDQVAVQSGSITGTSQVGGIVGLNFFGSVDQVAVQTGTVTGTGTDIGGIVGSNDNGTVTNSSFAGTVSASGASNVGGFVGLNTGGAGLALVIGEVTGGTNAGTVVGNNALGAVVQSVLYDTDINSLSPIGLNNGTVIDVIGGDFKTLGNLGTFTALGFSSSIWQATSGNYVSLIWCGSACTTPIYIPDLIPHQDEVITTQIVNAENTYKQEIPVELGILVDLVLTYGNDFMGDLDIQNDPNGMMASWFLTNTIILEIGFLLDEDPDTDPITIMKEVMEILSEHFNCE